MAQTVLYESPHFTVTADAVRQGDLDARAESPTRITSSYAGRHAPGLERVIVFKFALNGLDNERPPYQDHRVLLRPDASGRFTTPVYRFGQLHREEAAIPESVDPFPATVDSLSVTFRLDLRPVLNAFDAQGYFEAWDGSRIERSDFEGVWIAGSSEPLGWHFGSFSDKPHLRLNDGDGDGVYDVTVTFRRNPERPVTADGRAVWELGADLSGLPRLSAPEPLLEALYTLSLEETLLDIREDGAFMAGEKWTGVWTRDISYSILLAHAITHPENAKRSLMAKVADGRIIQDTGTGGSWPVSTDRMTWALAAWEVYRVTGEAAWLKESYAILKRSVEADRRTVLDPETGLVFGESSFLDWREQTYPRWMDPRDIYRSRTLGTSAVHARTYAILAEMAERLGERGTNWRATARRIADGINTHLWMGETGNYGQYLYGRYHHALSPRMEALGAALCVLFDIASPEQAARVTETYPLAPWGVPSIAPQIPGIPPYHNNGIWPFVQAYWTWAGAHSGNTAVVEHGLGAMTRAAALFLTNKENMVAETGHFDGTEINSDRQLWSVAGTLAMTYRVLFGMRFEADRLVFAPFVPEAYGGQRTLSGLRYRDALLTVTLRGHGREIAAVRLDGNPVPLAVIPGDLTGEHTLEIDLSGAALPAGAARIGAVAFTPETPEAVLANDVLSWSPIPDAVTYRVFRDGEPLTVTAATAVTLPGDTLPAEYQILAEDAAGRRSFLSEPRLSLPATTRLAVDAGVAGLALESEASGYGGKGYLRLTREENRLVTVAVEIPVAGRYAIEARYANGSGPINTDNRCAIRTLEVNGRFAGVLVMPQRGIGAWSDWGVSSVVMADLPAGRHELSVALRPENANMNGTDNTALLDALVLTRLE